MSNLLDVLLNNMGDEVVQGITQKLGTNKNQTQAAMGSAMSILLNALAKNSSNAKGGSSLEGALDRDHDGSILDNLGGYFNNPELANGNGILRHILGNKRKNVEDYISNDSGLSSSSVSKILEMAAPILMGMLGKEKKQGNSGIIDILGSLTGTMKKEAPKNQSVIEQLLDKDNDGTIMDDVAELGMSFLGKFLRK